MSQTVSKSAIDQVAKVVAKLPSPFNTKDVMTQVDMSRETLRRAMVTLVDRGLITRAPEPLMWHKTVQKNGAGLFEEDEDEADNPVAVAAQREIAPPPAKRPIEPAPKREDLTALFENFGDPIGDKAKRRPRPPGEARSRPGRALAKSVEEAVCLAFELNEQAKLPSHVDPKILTGHLSDQEIARWLSEEFPDNKRNYNSWLSCIRGQRSAYNRGQLPYQRKNNLKPKIEIHEWVQGEAQRNIRRPKQTKLDLKAVASDD